MARFVEVPGDVLLARLQACGEALDKAGGYYHREIVGREVVLSLTPAHGRVTLRVYTSVGQEPGGRYLTRACDDDAIRLVVGTSDEVNAFRPVLSPRKVLRTAPGGPQHERVAAFLDRLVDVLREEYRRALKVPSCSACGRAMAWRDVNGGFWGCSGYPRCRATSSA